MRCAHFCPPWLGIGGPPVDHPEPWRLLLPRGPQGAKFAWESAGSGREVCPEDVYGAQEIHVNGAVVLAFQLYYHATQVRGPDPPGPGTPHPRHGRPSEGPRRDLGWRGPCPLPAASPGRAALPRGRWLGRGQGRG